MEQNQTNPNTTTSFIKQDYSEIDFSAQQFSSEGVDRYEFNECTFYRCNFTELELEHIYFDKCRFNDCKFESVKLDGSMFTGCQFYGTLVLNCDWCNVHIKNSQLHYVNFGSSKFQQCLWEKNEILDTTLTEDSFHNTSFQLTRWERCRFTGSELRGCDFWKGYLGCDFTEEVFKSSVLFDNTDLTRTQLPESESIRKGIILQEPMTGWKKSNDGHIIQLEIPEGSVVFSVNNSTCRTNRVKVLDIVSPDGERDCTIVSSAYQEDFRYIVGNDMVIPDFDLNYSKESSQGIHFFRTKQDAENYIPIRYKF